MSSTITKPQTNRRSKHPPLGPIRLFELVSGMDWICWGLPITLLLLLINLRIDSPLPSHVLGIIMTFWGLRVMMVNGKAVQRWRKPCRWLFLNGFLLLYLTPFLQWWLESPRNIYFAAHALGFFISITTLLALLNLLCARIAESFGEREFRSEAVGTIWATLVVQGLPILFCLYRGVAFYREHHSAPFASLIFDISQMHLLLVMACSILVLMPFTLTTINLWRCRNLCILRLENILGNR
jgi:hypothetical protein